MYAAAARARFVDQTLETASPAKQLTMLYDRLCLDLARAEQAQHDGNRPEAHRELVHAQDIVAALLDALDSTWEGAESLAALYRYLLTELVSANVAGDAERTASCLRLVEPLRDAWHEAARTASVAHGSGLVAQLA